MKTSDITVFAIGSHVRIGGDIRAIVTSVQMCPKNHVAYECSWWDGLSHQCKWLEDFEVVLVDASEVVRIGFVHG